MGTPLADHRRADEHARVAGPTSVAPSGAALGMAGPAILLLLCFVGAPFIVAVGLSFTNLRLGSPMPLEFVGFEHYRQVLTDPVIRRAFINNLTFAATIVPVQTSLALLLAVLLDRGTRLMAGLRTLFFLPVVFPMALVAVIWTLLLAPGDHGPVNAILSRISFGAWSPRDFLHDQHWALPAIMLTSLWQGTGFQMVILLAGLQGIPRELYEAARIDGAGSWRCFVHVTVPGLRNVLLFVVLVTSILAFRLFDQVQIMTRGGPGSATTTVMYEAVRTAFTRQQIAGASALTVVFFLVVLVVTLGQRKLVRQREAVR